MRIRSENFKKEGESQHHLQQSAEHGKAADKLNRERAERVHNAVIGQTKSGKDIRATTNIANSKEHKNWTAQDHLDAAQHHKDLYTYHALASGTNYSNKKMKQLKEDYKHIDKDKLKEGSSFNHAEKGRYGYHDDSAEDHRNMMKKHLAAAGQKMKEDQ